MADDRLLTLVAEPCALDDWRDTTVSKQADALPANGVHTLQFPESLEALAAHPLLTVVETTHIDEQSVPGAPVFTYEVGFRPWRADLSDVVYKEPLSLLPEGEFALYAACWLRVTDQTGAKVHDAVPAVDPAADVPQALFRFASPKALAYSKLVADTSAQATDAAAVWEPAAFAAVDPRFNWAPEQWYATGAGWDGATWLAAQQALGEDGRDGDIFLNALAWLAGVDAMTAARAPGNMVAVGMDRAGWLRFGSAAAGGLPLAVFALWALAFLRRRERA